MTKAVFPFPLVLVSVPFFHHPPATSTNTVTLSPRQAILAAGAMIQDHRDYERRSLQVLELQPQPHRSVWNKQHRDVPLWQGKHVAMSLLDHLHYAKLALILRAHGKEYSYDNCRCILNNCKMCGELHNLGSQNLQTFCDRIDHLEVPLEQQ